jgi:DNA-binding LytR/AlgR family response regulator
MIRCIVIDDSPLALDLLGSYIKKIPYLQPVASCTNALEAIEIIRKGSIDLIFLDMEMPDITGIDLLRSLAKRPKVIFTTAYPNYALEGFNLNATDYLLKPFSFDRFKQACDKALQMQEFELNQLKSNLCIFIKSGHDSVKVPIQRILYIEAMRDYIQVFTDDQKIMSLMNMKDIIEMLPTGEFVRIHRSFIIPISKVSKVSSKKVLIGTKEIPIGEMFRDEFLKLFKKRNIIH